MGRFLTEKERQFVRIYYPKHQAKGTSKRFNKRFGASTTPASMKKIACKIGVTREAPPGFYTSTELSIFCDIKRSNIINQIKFGNIKAVKMGGRFLIDENEADRVIKEYNYKPEWQSISTIDASMRLGYSVGKTKSSSVLRLAVEKRIPSYKIKNKRFVPLAYIEAAELQMMRTGRNWVSWIKIHEELNYAV